MALIDILLTQYVYVVGSTVSDVFRLGTSTGLAPRTVIVITEGCHELRKI